MAVARLHRYAATVTWAGPSAGSTETYAGYSREHTIVFEGKDVVLRASSDKMFRGDPKLPNPEELLVASLSSCHMLSYLASCALEGIEIVSYLDRARGVMSEVGGAGHFVSVELGPQVVIARASELERARALHQRAHETCFIANSVNFPVTYEPVVNAL
jgi:organic hydroperoxide reductase OsmC/OhrA